jgi:20S proteasome alpha/beta subunit
MTICIGALAENRKKLVLVSDRMITANIPMPYQFEKEDVQKIYDITDNVKVLTAGNALFAYEVIQAAVTIIEKQKLDGKDAHSVEEVAEILRQVYQQFRLRIVIQRILEPRGLDLPTYYSQQKNLNPGIIQEIEQALVNANIDVELVVAGVNDGKSCHLYTVTHPGTVACHDPIGYACVGSGAPHAMYSLIGSEYTKDKTVDSVEKLVLEAKKKSEVAPGVGRDTVKMIMP